MVGCLGTSGIITAAAGSRILIDESDERNFIWLSQHQYRREQHDKSAHDHDHAALLEPIHREAIRSRRRQPNTPHQHLRSSM